MPKIDLENSYSWFERYISLEYTQILKVWILPHQPPDDHIHRQDVLFVERPVIMHPLVIVILLKKKRIHCGLFLIIVQLLVLMLTLKQNVSLLPLNNK